MTSPEGNQVSIASALLISEAPRAGGFAASSGCGSPEGVYVAVLDQGGDMGLALGWPSRSVSTPAGQQGKEPQVCAGAGKEDNHCKHS